MNPAFQGPDTAALFLLGITSVLVIAAPSGLLRAILSAIMLFINTLFFFFWTNAADHARWQLQVESAGGLFFLFLVIAAFIVVVVGWGLSELFQRAAHHK